MGKKAPRSLFLDSGATWVFGAWPQVLVGQGQDAGVDQDGREETQNADHDDAHRGAEQVLHRAAVLVHGREEKACAGTEGRDADEGHERAAEGVSPEHFVALRQQGEDEDGAQSEHGPEHQGGDVQGDVRLSAGHGSLHLTKFSVNFKLLYILYTII
jgi:hypothetical protein